MKKIDVKKISKLSWIIILSLFSLSLVSFFIGFIGIPIMYKNGNLVNLTDENRNSAPFWVVLIGIVLVLPLIYNGFLVYYSVSYTRIFYEKWSIETRSSKFYRVAKFYGLYRIILWFFVKKYNLVIEAKKNLWLFDDEQKSWLSLAKE